MTPQDVYCCIESVLRLPLSKQAVCVRLAAEASATVWQEWCRLHRIEDHSRTLLECFDRWLGGTASGEELDQIDKQLYETLPKDLPQEKQPAGGYAGWALRGIALIALDQCAEVHHSILHSAICYAAAAHCRIGVEAVWVDLDRLTPDELEFLHRWWRRCCELFPELAGTSNQADRTDRGQP